MPPAALLCASHPAALPAASEGKGGGGWSAAGLVLPSFIRKELLSACMRMWLRSVLRKKSATAMVAAWTSCNR
jgi:hypothetical protein